MCFRRMVSSFLGAVLVSGFAFLSCSLWFFCLFVFLSCEVQSLRISLGEQAMSLLHQALRIHRRKKYALKVT